MARASDAPWVLGLSSSHNGGACLLRGNEIVVAIQEERLLRKKRADHPCAYDSLAIQYCLEYAGIESSQLSMVVHCSTPPVGTVHEDVTLNPALQTAKHGIRTLTIGHHLAHAAGAYAISGFEESAVLVVDGYGSQYCELDGGDRSAVNPAHLEACSGALRGEPREIISLYSARGPKLTCVAKHISAAYKQPKEGMPYFWSLGTMYESAGALIFGSRLDGAGKVMGLAPYGNPTIVAGDFFEWTGDGFSFLPTVPDRFLEGEGWPSKKVDYQNLAASVQEALEAALLQVAGQLKSLVPSRNLCFAGGVALNSVANERLCRTAGFDDVFLMPSAEDSGTALGAAFYGLWELTGNLTPRRIKNDSTGRVYSQAQIRQAVSESPGVAVVDADPLVQAAQLLADGAIVGWFQGGSELGPRALGQRSILCDPRRPGMKDMLNERVKFREPFRPFAPVVLQQHLAEWFEVPCPQTESPFMLRVMPFLEHRRAEVPAVVHVDGSGRVQTVTEETNSLLYKLIESFRDLTGVPVLLNTSFNVAGEPIVETPEDALWCFLSSDMDYCVLGDMLVRKVETFQSVLQFRYEVVAERVSMDFPSSALALEFPQSKVPLAPFLLSSHISRLSDAERILMQHPKPVLRAISRKPWGRTLHVMDPVFGSILRATDGARTGHDIHAHLLLEDPGWSMGTVRSMVAQLVRASILRPLV